MYGKMVLLSCIATAMLTIRAQKLDSPCSNVFSYERRNSETDRWYGVILLSTDVDLHSVWIEVELDRTAHLLGNWYGEVTSQDNRVFTITNRKKMLSPGPATPVRIFVKYNELEQIPVVRSIQLNGRKICPSSSSSSSSSSNSNTQQSTTNNRGTQQQSGTNNRGTQQQPSRTTEAPLVLQTNGYVETTRRTTSKRPTQNSNSGLSNTITATYNSNRPSNVNPNTFEEPETNYNIITTRRTTSTTQNFDWLPAAKPVISQSHEDDGFESELRPGPKPNVQTNQQNSGGSGGGRDTLLSARNGQCGVVAVQAKPLITHGQETKEGQWPWHAAIYRGKGIDLSYICGASLVSPNALVTAAHCVARKNSNRPIDHETLLIYLGKYNLRIWTSDGIQVLPIEEIIIHPHYNYSNFHNDVAVLKLKKPAKYSTYVRPVCLWRESTDLSTVLNREGTVVGWGYDETGRVTEQLAMAKMPVVSQDTCIWSHPDFFPKFTSDKTYCAGFRNGTSVCNGDSGGGMVFPQPGTNPQVWQLRGLVSISVALQNEFICDSHHYVVFTDLAKHQQWLQAVISQ